MRLYTNRSLAEAKAMYRGRGYVEIARYNDDPYADHWFEKQLRADGGAWAGGSRARAVQPEKMPVGSLSTSSIVPP